jgi:hypothetical protein
MNLFEPFASSRRFLILGHVVLFGLAAFVLALTLQATAGLALFFITALIVLGLALYKPLTVLKFLLVYLPLEPFLLKWVEDGIYIYARYASEMLIYVLAFSVGVLLITGRRSWIPTRIDIPFALFVLVLIVSSLLNGIFDFSLILGVRQVIRFMLLYFITLQLNPSREWVYSLFKWLLVILSVQIMLGLSQFAFGEPVDSFLLPSERRTFGAIELTQGVNQFWDPGQRVFGTMGRYDQLGVFLAFMLIVLTAVLYEWKLTRRGRQLISAIFLLGLVVLALTYSRSSWFGYLIGLSYISLFVKKDRRVLRGFVIAGAVIVGYALLSGLQVGGLVDVPGQTLAERFFEAFSFERWRGEYFGLGRLYWIVQTLLVVLPAAPFFGHGVASFGGGAVSALQNTRVYDELGLPFGVYGTQGIIDNNWFSVLGESGLVGLALFASLFFVAYKYGRKLHAEASTAYQRVLGLAVPAIILAGALHGFLATFFEIRTYAPFLWVGIAIVAGELAKKRS